MADAGADVPQNFDELIRGLFEGFCPDKGGGTLERARIRKILMFMMPESEIV